MFDIMKAMVDWNGPRNDVYPSRNACRCAFVDKRVDAAVVAWDFGACRIPARGAGGRSGESQPKVDGQRPGTPCSGLEFDLIPQSCFESSG
jgi:hypothetical protein